MKTLPNTGPELVLDMLAQFPEVLPSPGRSYNEILFAAGQRSVALHYASMMNRDISELTAAAEQRRAPGRQLRG